MGTGQTCSALRPVAKLIPVLTVAEQVLTSSELRNTVLQVTVATFIPYLLHFKKKCLAMALVLWHVSFYFGKADIPSVS